MTSAPLLRQPVFDAFAAICPPGTLDDPGYRLAIDNLLDAMGAPVDRADAGSI